MIQRVKVNLIPSYQMILPVIHLKQYDKTETNIGKQIELELYSGDDVYEIPSGTTVTFQGTKLDKTGYQYEVTNVSGNLVTVDIKDQMTVLSGRHYAELRISKDGTIINSTKVLMDIDSSALEDDTVISDTDLPLIEEGIEAISTILGTAKQVATNAKSASTSASNAKTSETNASKSEANAKTYASNAKTSETNSKTSETNAKASETNASTSATNASTSATNASNSEANAKTYASNASASATNAKTSETNAKNTADSISASLTQITTNKNDIATLIKELCYVGLRYKNLGTSLTTAQATAIANGDFSDLWNGDYWVINGVNWRIVDNTDLFYNFGDTQFEKHGLIVMPDKLLLGGTGTGAWMNDTNTTEGGYASTKYRNTYRSQLVTTISNVFGSAHIGTHRELICNAVSSGQASGWAWVDANVELPTEENIYGTNVWGRSVDAGSGGYNVGVNHSQFALFKLAPKWICNRQNYWLRSAVGASWFALVDYSGHAVYNDAAFGWVGFRPYFILV